MPNLRAAQKMTPLRGVNMVFSSNTFLFIFLPFTLLIYHLLRQEVRQLFLLAASFVFCSWANSETLTVLLSVIALSYFGGLLIGSVREKRKGLSRAILAAIIIVDVGLLAYFKYTSFIISTKDQDIDQEVLLQSELLPVGISFFVFQSISYIADVYSGKIAADRNIISVALYFALFPKLTQGPIMRYGDMTQTLKKCVCSVDDMTEGIQRFIIGLTKKVLIADILGSVADPIFALEQPNLGMALAWGGIVAYTLQIYFDFSGYTDMAIGLGRMFGYRFSENFQYPYLSTSITEFWRRWHISLSTWFRDYIYIPLGGNRRGNQYLHIAVVFLATGLWHGTAWTFVVWGAFHGVFNILEKALNKKGLLSHIPSVIRWLATMLLIMIGWVLFRAESLDAAWYYLKAMFGFGHADLVQYQLRWFYTNKIILITVIGILASVPWKKLFPAIGRLLEKKRAGIVMQWCALGAMLVVSIMLVMTSTNTSFIYFRF